jgi:hypothetical protein
MAPAPALEVRADGEPNIWDILTGISGPASLSGPEVSPLSALNASAVRAAVDLIAGIMGTLPVSIYQTANGGGQEVAAGHAGQFLVAQDANPSTSASELRYAAARGMPQPHKRPPRLVHACPGGYGHAAS